MSNIGPPQSHVFTGLRPDRFITQLVLQSGHQGLAALIGSALMSADQRIQFSQPVRVSHNPATGTDGIPPPFFREYSQHQPEG